MNTFKPSQTTLLVLCVSGVFTFALSAQAASFDCGKAQSKVEHLICDNPELSKLDDDLSKAYQQAQHQRKNIKMRIKEQRQWLKERSVCTDVDCLEMAYRSRIDELNPDQTRDRFIPILSKDKPLCDAYKRYIEQEVALRDQNTPHASPMCRRSFGAAYTEFKSVKWREIQPKDYPELAVEAYRYINNDLPWSPPWLAKQKLTDKAYQINLDAIKLNYSNEWFFMWMGEADIGNTGQPETLLKVDDGRCGFVPDLHPPRWKVPVMVLDSSAKHLIDKSEWLLGASIIPKTPDFDFEGMHELDTRSFDVFAYRGKTYFDVWEVEWDLQPGKLIAPKPSKVSVLRISQETTEAVCRFKLKK